MASELAGEMEDCSLAMGGPVFTPRLYQQRYSAVVNLCNRLRAKNVSIYTLQVYLYTMQIIKQTVCQKGKYLQVTGISLHS